MSRDRERSRQELLVDPAVSRAKFDRELEEYRAIAADQRKLGWWILSAEYPNVLVAFTVPHLRPSPVALGAVLNFDNYDLWPPSVTIVNPFTAEPLKYREIPEGARMLRVDAATGQVLPLLQAHRVDDIPFVCIEGVREYHDHPAHTGDDWFLHRGGPRGKLFFLLEKLYIYGARPFRGFEIAMGVRGLLLGEIPS